MTPSDPTIEARVRGVAKTIAAEFKRVLSDFFLRSRQKNPDTLLKNSTRTEFNPDVFSSMNMPKLHRFVSTASRVKMGSSPFISN
jgi:hypothetical protein